MTWSTMTWTIARASGMTAFLIVTLAVALGLALSMRWQAPRWPRLITNEMHNFLAVLSLVFLGVHGLALWLDPYINFTALEVFVPFTSHYRTLGVGLGIVAAYLLVAVWISTEIRSHIPYSWWRRFHATTFGVYLLSAGHGILSGSDTHTLWALALYAGSMVLVGTLLEARFRSTIGSKGIAHPQLANMTVAATGLGVFWAVMSSGVLSFGL